MSLTLPKAGTNPGRAARAGGVAAPTFAKGLEGLGQVMQELGDNLETDRLNREYLSLQNDFTREINDLRLEIETIGDPDAADKAWQTGIDTINAGYELRNAETGHGRVDPKLKDRFNNTRDQLINAATFQVGKRNLGLRNAQREAIFIDYAHTATRTAATSEAPMREQIIAQGNEHIDALVGSGTIDAAEAERRRIALSKDVSSARAIDMLDTNPGGLIGEIDAGGLEGLSAEELSRYRARATTNLASQAEKAAKQRDKAIKTELANFRGIFSDGRQSPSEDRLKDPVVMAHPDYAETMAARSLRDEEIDLKTLTPNELKQLIADEEKKPVSHDYKTERLKLLKEVYEDHEAGYDTDPIAYAQTTGANAFGMPDFVELPEFDPSNPSDFEAAIESRQDFGRALVDRGFTDNERVFTDDELEDIRAKADKEKDPKERAALAASLAKSLRGSDQSAADVLKDPVMAHVGDMMISTGRTRLGEEILRGQQSLALDNIELPPFQERKGVSFDVLQTVFADLPSGERFESKIVSAADALYSRRMGRIDPTADIDDDVYSQALHEVLGGSGSYGTRDARGGIQEIRGSSTVLPAGVLGEKVESSIDRIGFAPDLANKKRPTFKFSGEAALAQLKAASGGQTPDIDGELPDQRTLEDLQLQAVANDRYIFVRPLGSGLAPSVLMNDDGLPFTFSLRALMRGVEQ